MMNTPESLRVARSDSKNPTETCKGLTENRRHCRRGLAAGGLGIRRSGSGEGPEYYCHLHKNQAEIIGLVQSGGEEKSKGEQGVIREKSSIETLVQRLGIQSLGEGKKKKKKSKIESQWEYAGEESQTSLSGGRGKENGTARHNEKKKKLGFWAWLFGEGGQGNGDYVEIVRHKKRLDAQAQPPTTHNLPAKTTTSRPKPERKADSNPATYNLLALLPPHLSPETTSTLLAELIKPISSTDEEGYIYIYWLTTTTPDEGTKRDLLAPPSQKPTNTRRVSDVLAKEEYSSGTRPGTLMLKIGRANNINRRMKEWERQCGLKLNLLRWYPYTSSASSSPSGLPRRNSEGRKVPNVKRVERLVHLELASQQVRKQCGACGKEHREWFEVEGTREGARRVDEVVRRWVGWAEGKGGDITLSL